MFLYFSLNYQIVQITTTKYSNQIFVIDIQMLSSNLLIHYHNKICNSYIFLIVFIKLTFTHNSHYYNSHNDSHINSHNNSHDNSHDNVYIILIYHYFLLSFYSHSIISHYSISSIISIQYQLLEL